MNDMSHMPTGGGDEPRDLNEIARGWDFDPAEETANVRLFTGSDGAERVQLRIRFGVMQVYADGTPETGGASILDELNRELAEHRARRGSDRGFSISAMRTAQISQEIMDYYQRRVCFFLLGDYRRAMRDAEHNLDLMRLIKKYSVDDRTVVNHDRYRPFVLMDRARAAAMIAVEEDEFDRAMVELDEGVEAIRAFYREYEREDLLESSNEVEMLQTLRSDLRREYSIPMSKSERLQSLKDEQAQAIAKEDYERAARLRDEIEKIEQHGKLQF